MKVQDYVMNTLLSLKHLTSFFHTFATEAGSSELESITDAAYNDLLTKQREVYQFIVKEGWMKVQYQTKANIEKEYKKYKNKSCE